MNWIELLNGLPWESIVEWVVGIIGISGITLGWKTFKKGKKMHNYYYEAKENGWDEAEKDKYIQYSAAFFQSFKNLWTTIISIFKK